MRLHISEIENVEDSRLKSILNYLNNEGILVEEESELNDNRLSVVTYTGNVNESPYYEVFVRDGFKTVTECYCTVAGNTAQIEIFGGDCGSARTETIEL